MGVSEKKFGVLPDGEQVKMFHLENKSGAYVEVTDFGALLVKVCVPDKDGKLTDVVLGYDDLESYEVNGCFFGAVIGRSGNRMRMTIICTVVLMHLRRNCGRLQKFPRRKTV